MSTLQLTTADVSRLLKRLGGERCALADGRLTYSAPGLQVTASGLEVRGALHLTAGALELQVTGLKLSADGACLDLEIGAGNRPDDPQAASAGAQSAGVRPVSG